MNLNLTIGNGNCPLLASTVFLLFTTAIPALAQSPLPVLTQPSEQNSLMLTAEQQQTVQQIQRSSRAAIAKILTADQKARLDAERNATSLSQVVNSLNLTEEQRRQVLIVLHQAHERLNALLTPKQRQQLQQQQGQTPSPQTLLPEITAPFPAIQLLPLPERMPSAGPLMQNPPPAPPPGQNPPGSLRPGQNPPPGSPPQNPPPGSPPPMQNPPLPRQLP